MNQIRERASIAWNHLGSSALGRLARRQPAPAVAVEKDEAEASGAQLFFWGALTGLLLWWLYVRPKTAERRLQRLRAGQRPGPRAGSRPANARPPQHREQAPPPERTPKPAAASEDDFTLLFGIGPARAARLREAGITSFEALALADAEQLRDILGGAEVGTWPEQATLAARGDWDGLHSLQEQLRAERG